MSDEMINIGDHVRCGIPKHEAYRAYAGHFGTVSNRSDDNVFVKIGPQTVVFDIGQIELYSRGQIPDLWPDDLMPPEVQAKIDAKARYEAKLAALLAACDECCNNFSSKALLDMEQKLADFRAERSSQ